MEPSLDTNLEEMLTRTGSALTPDRAQLRMVLQRSIQKQTRPQLSPLSFTFFMNTASKVFVALAVVIVVAGTGYYFSSTPMSDSDVTPNPVTTTTETPSVQQPSAAQDQLSAPVLAQASGVTEIDTVSSALQDAVNDQLSALTALDTSTSKVVASVDTGNSSGEPYDPSQI